MDIKNESRKHEQTETQGDEQAMNKDNFERKLEEALIFGRRSSLARTPPSTPPVSTIRHQDAGNTAAARRSLRSTDKGTPIEGDMATVQLSDEDDSVWLDEEMTSPIYRLYNSQDTGNRVHVDSPAKKKRKRDELVAADSKEKGQTREMMEVQTFMTKLNNKTDELRKLVKESTKTKTEIKAATR
ncbi:hypothetical protein QE152_g7658 [Popillia japonica]|uniref:Uncharacterized protein n=1 Tax=Popillia japonica TaxID=7064 RepID=A0AAW1M987_POPJA